MNNVIDEVLANSPRYTIKDNGGTTLYDNVQIDLATEVTTTGTALNKALFDSIQADLNTRLLIADKSTTSEAQQGTNNAHYMTPLRVKEQLQYLTKTGSGSNSSTTAQNTTIYSSSNVPSGAKRVTISGTINAVSNTYPCLLNINGSNIVATKLGSNTYPTISSTQIQTRFGRAGQTAYDSFELNIDLNTQSYTFLVRFEPNVSGQPNEQADIVIGRGTISSVVASLRGTGSSASSTSYTITYTY